MRYYTVTQVARKFGISRQGAYQWLKRSQIKPVNPGEVRENGIPYIGMYKAKTVEKKRVKISDKKIVNV